MKNSSVVLGLDIVKDPFWRAVHQNSFKGVDIMKYFDKEHDRLKKRKFITK